MLHKITFVTELKRFLIQSTKVLNPTGYGPSIFKSKKLTFDSQKTNPNSCLIYKFDFLAKIISHQNTGKQFDLHSQTSKLSCFPFRSTSIVVMMQIKNSKNLSCGWNSIPMRQTTCPIQRRQKRQKRYQSEKN